MNTRRFLAVGIAALVCSVSASAQTWDGGGINDNLNNAANWNPDGVPGSNADVIFAGLVRLTPSLSSAFQVNSLTFSNTAGPFVFGGAGTLSIKTGGLTNNDTQTQTFNNPVSFGLTASSSINAAAGALLFNGPTSIGVAAVTLEGANAITFGGAPLGTGILLKNSSGPLQLTATSTPIAASLTLNSGVTTLTATGSTQVFSNGSLSIGVGAIIHIEENAIFDSGSLTRSIGGTLTVAAGKTLTLQNSADLNANGVFSLSANSSIVINGAGSTLTSTSTLSVNSGASVSVTGGGSLSSSGTPIGIGTSGNGTATVSGAGSTMSGSTLSLGFSGANGTLNFSSGSSGSFGAINVAHSASAGSAATLSVLSGTMVTGTALNMAGFNSTVTSNVTISGAGSSLTISGASLIGASAASTATLELLSGGTFHSGTQPTTVNPTGTIAINSGTFNANGNLVLNGGQLTRSGGGTLNLNANSRLIVQNGGDAVITGNILQPNRADLTVQGAGSTLSTTGDFQWNGSGNTLAFIQVLDGGVLNSGGAVHLARNNDAVSMTVAGVGAQVIGSPFFTSEWQAGVVVRNRGTVALGGLRLADTSFGSSSFGSLTVQSGSTVSAGTISVATVTAPANGEITVEGVGSAVTQSGNAGLKLGASAVSTAKLSVKDGGVFTTGTGSITLNPTSTVTIAGGTLDLRGPLFFNGGAVTFTSGALSIVSDWHVGSTGLLGSNVSFQAGHRFTTTAATTIDAFQTLTLAGGFLSTGSLSNNGTFDFQKGILAITGAGGMAIGTGSALGGNVTLGTTTDLRVMNTLSVASGAALTVAGGVFTAGTLTNAGTIRANAGHASASVGTNLAGGRIFISELLEVAGTLTNASGSRITLENGTGLLGGAGALTNSGVILGDGTIAKPLTNNSSGEVRAEAGRTLNFTSSAANAGQLNLVGGTLDFSGALTNQSSGFISGHGALFTGGLTNAGTMAFSGGHTAVRGDITNAAGARIITSGGATTTFFDDVQHDGLEIRTSAGGASVFLGSASGAGAFTGTGTVFFEGDLRPGNSPALVTFGGDVVYGNFNTVVMELGGPARGSQYDAINVAGKLTFDGGLSVPLIGGFQPGAGQVFNLFDFGSAAGTFDTVTLPSLAPGLLWSQANLYSAGEIAVALDPTFTSRVWDGGGVNNLWITDANWTLDVQPLNNGTADLVFAGNVRLTPSVDSPWNVRSITFDNTAGAFTITGPQSIALGVGGITNNDSQMQTISAALALGANASFTAAAGDLAVVGPLALGGKTLTISGANDVRIGAVNGAGAIVKNNDGELVFLGTIAGGATISANTGTTAFHADASLSALHIGTGAIAQIADGPAPFAAASVPEPGTTSLLLLALPIALHRRRAR